jgi:hypothetical protein
MSDDARFAATGPGKYKQRSIRMLHRLALGIVQRLHKVFVHSARLFSVTGDMFLRAHVALYLTRRDVARGVIWTTRRLPSAALLGFVRAIEADAFQSFVNFLKRLFAEVRDAQ